MKKTRKIMALVMAFMICMAVPVTALADAVVDQPYVALGADLNADEKAKVLSNLEITEADLEGYDVVYVTNAEEHQYLGSYLSDSVIGTRALSSVIITKKDKGNGLNIVTKNISYCTIGMYQNALITAGVEDADIIVAGPFPLSGTAGLVGILKAYEHMTGNELSNDNVDAALDELVTTGEISDSVGDTEVVEDLIAAVKQKVIEQDLSSTEDIGDAIDEVADELEINLSAEDRQRILDLMEKIKGLDIDIDALKNQAKDLYDRISNIDFGGDSSGVVAFFRGILQSIGDFFKGLFN